MILHVITDPERRGAQVFATELAQGLADLGVESRIVALGPGQASGAIVPVEVLGRNRRDLGTLRALRRAMLRVDVVVAHGSTTLPMCVLAAIGRRCPIVYRQIGDPRYWLTTLRRRLQTRFALGRVRRVVALWAGGAKALVEDLGVPETGIVIIPNGVREERLPPLTETERAAARGRFEVPDGSPVAAIISALSPEKGIETAIRAITRPGMLRWRLLIAGDGPDRVALQRVADEVASGRVHFLGAIQDVRAVLAAADALGLPSRSEGMPAALIEAAVLGIPAVVTDVGATAEVVVDGVTGRLVPQGDVEQFARALMEVHARSAEMGAAARARCVERFTMDAIAARWAELLREVAVK